MKKILLAIFLLAAVGASAQMYTLQRGQRESTFYYYGRNWIDYCHSGTEMGIHLWHYCSPTYLRFFETSRPLKIIGIAGCCSDKYADWIRRQNYTSNWNFRDTVNRVPEYFQLYKATSSDPVLLAETRWDTAHPRYQWPFWGNYRDVRDTFGPGRHWRQSLDTMLLYEAFFDKPITVTDSFFVGGTSYNNTFYYNENTGHYEGLEHPYTSYLLMYMEGGEAEGPCHSCPMTPHENMTVRFHTQQYVRTFEIDGWLDALDSNWVINQCCNPKTCSWPVFFPIIDTTGMGLDGFQWAEGYGCTTVQTFHLLYVEGQKAYLSWNANSDALFYEVSYGPADIVGNSPELGTKLRLNTSMVCLDSLEPGRRYVAFVRAHCAENAKSLWTEGETFQALASGNIIEDSPASRFTAVMPNPTSSQASVVCSFSINKIEIYTATGQLVKTVKVSANTASLNLSDLPAGTYILRIQTSAGDVAKKLQKL